MATIFTHSFAGAALASVLTPRPKPFLYWAMAALLPVVPDLDVFSGAAYGAMSGHRGFTHTPAFALVVGFAVAAATYRFCRVDFWPLFGLFTLVTASHGVLDALTTGGFGIAFLWPFSDRRWGPYGPIAVSDFLPDPFTSRAVRTELLYVWLPLGAAVVAVQAFRWARSRAGGRRGAAGGLRGAAQPAAALPR